jgi:Na+-translocating ferredoxin:NAD+ oxidoreductase RnfC subunit
MPQRRAHFVDLPPPQVIWLAAGSAARSAVPQARVGTRVPAGAVVAGVEHTSTLAVTPLAGEVGEPTTFVDSAGRPKEGVTLRVAPGAAAEPGPRGKPPALQDVSREDLPEWVDRLTRAGVRADRHNSPDLIAQLIAAIDRPVDSLICHALETDPTLPVQAQWALRHPLELRDGLRVLARLTGARRAVLAVAEGDNRRIYRHLRRSARSELTGKARREPAEGKSRSEPRDIDEGQSVILPLDPSTRLPTEDLATADEAPVSQRARRTVPPTALGLRMIPVRNAYPQADPTLLVWALLSARLPPDRLPIEAGALVLDAVAAVAVGAVARGEGVIQRQPLAVRDHARDLSILADIWRGSRTQEVLSALGLEAESLRAGDFLRERYVPLESVLDGGEIVLHITGPEQKVVPEPCIRCGWCLDICPTHVHPAGVLEGAQRDDEDIARQYGVNACIECGLCSYVCPSRLPLLKAAQLMKAPDLLTRR